MLQRINSTDFARQLVDDNVCSYLIDLKKVCTFLSGRFKLCFQSFLMKSELSENQRRFRFGTFFSSNSKSWRTEVLDGGSGEPEPPPRNLADQLTLFKPGGQIMPLKLLPAPRIQKAIYTPVGLYCLHSILITIHTV